MATSQDLINRYQNPGIFVNEIDNTTNVSVTTFDGVIHLVPGFSKIGPQNRPIFIQNKEAFNATYGNSIDYKLERKESYFHRTALKMIETGPTYCMSILYTDPTLDKLNWQTFSTASHLTNEQSRTNPYADFFDRTDFWQLSTDQVINISKKYSVDNSGKLLTFVNMSPNPITIWIFKSPLTGFDRTCEDWYGAKIPSYLHPKELISDFMVRVIVVKGDWTDYHSLAVNPQWSKYFNVKGLYKSAVNSFIQDRNVSLIYDLQVSLIPDFTDALGRDLFIQSVINSKTDSSGIFCAYDRDQYETDFRNGFVDLIGYNLVQVPTFGLNFLSYKEQIVNELLIDEKFIDQAGNSWGDPAWVSQNRTAINADGYINDTQLKPLIISQTTSFVVKPFVIGSNSYAIVKGKKIPITQQEYLLELNKIVSPGYKFSLVLVMTENGAVFKLGPTVLQTSTLPLPAIDAANEYVIGYYIIEEDSLGEYHTTLVGVTITDDSPTNINNDGLFGWIPAFASSQGPVPKITFDTVGFNYQTKLRFQNALKPIIGDYNQNRIYYLYTQLIKNLIENQSIILDQTGFKRTISKVEPGIDGNDRTILLTINDQNPNIVLPPNTGNGWISIYYTDLEFLYQTANYISTNPSPYTLPASGGRLGPESFLYKSYFEGLVSTGDRVFNEIATETNISFVNNNGQDLIVFNDPILGTYSGKIYINNTVSNNGIFTILGSTIYNNNYALIVNEDIIGEDAAVVQFFDANQERYFRFYFVGSDLYVEYESASMDQDAMLKDIEEEDANVKFKRTLEIAQIVDLFTVLVDYKTYAGKIAVGQYLQAYNDPKDLIANPQMIERGWTRILEVHPYDETQTLLLVRTDWPIYIYDFPVTIPNVDRKQTLWFLPIDSWVTTYKGFHLVGFNVGEHSIPDGTEDKLAKILSVIAPGTGLYNGLSNINKLTWRYLIDSFGLGFNPNTKYPFASICAKHSSLGFLNVPSIKQFSKYSDVTFTTSDGRFDLNKMLTGGDKTSAQSTYFTLIGDGTSANISYFFPYVQIQDLTQNRPMMIPPASLAADAYMRNKWQSIAAVIYPWSIVAGWQFGRVNDMSAVEQYFDDDELGQLHNMRINVITQDRNDRFYLNTEDTAYPYTSSLSEIHVREALINFEEEMRNMLLGFQWGANTDEIRKAIVKQANIIAKKYIDQNAFYAVANVMDSTNNTKEMIDAGIGLLDTFIEPVQGMGIILLNLNIMKTGQISSQQFYSQS